MLEWMAVTVLSSVLAVLLLAVPRLHFAVPWLGLITVVAGTHLAFSSSATLVDRGSIGFGGGWVMTSIFGMLGLAIAAPGFLLRPMPLMALGPIGAGLVHIASFYAFLPPRALDPLLIFAAPGVALIAFGAFLWWRYGLLAGRQRQRAEAKR